ncbi:hypothetical protein GIB67_021849 [Kingdonia uniflora]|uniref:PRA1 family protein n=1 Tax=Kingdonia uniflora TaxID=39325 RepID=A0A7J7P861_9MAGN|nr:hypothetical protein GIB67_021849 [Kingdonia uniflora]
MTTSDTVPTSTPGLTGPEPVLTLKQRLRSTFGTLRPWKTMFNLHSLGHPHSYRECVSRLDTNLDYYRMNYTIMGVVVIIIHSLVWHPWSLFVYLVMVCAWFALYVLRREYLTYALLTNMTMSMVVSVVVGYVLVLIHGVLRKTEVLVVEEKKLE